MVFVFNGIHYVLRYYSERACVSTKHSSEDLKVLLLLRSQHCVGLGASDAFVLSVGEHDIEGVNVVNAESEGVDQVPKASCLSVPSQVHSGTLTVRNSNSPLLELP